MNLQARVSDEAIAGRNWTAFATASNVVAARSNLAMWIDNAHVACTFDGHFTFTFANPMHAGEVADRLFSEMWENDPASFRDVGYGHTWDLARDGNTLTIVEL